MRAPSPHASPRWWRVLINPHIIYMLTCCTCRETRADLIHAGLMACACTRGDEDALAPRAASNQSPLSCPDSRRAPGEKISLISLRCERRGLFSARKFRRLGPGRRRVWRDRRRWRRERASCGTKVESLWLQGCRRAASRHVSRHPSRVWVLSQSTVCLSVTLSESVSRLGLSTTQPFHAYTRQSSTYDECRNSSPHTHKQTDHNARTDATLGSCSSLS